MKVRGGDRPRPATLVLALVLALTGLLYFTQTSAASRLTLDSPARGTFQTAARCSGNRLTITISGSTIGVSGIDAAACSAKTLAVYVRRAGATQTVSTTITGSTASLSLGSAVTAADGVAATIATWGVPVTWSVASPTLPLLTCESLGNSSLPCTATIERLTSWGNAPNRQYELFVKVTTTSSSQVRWAVTVNLSSSQLPFLARGVQDIQGGLRMLDFSGCSANPRTIRFQQEPSWANAKITSGQSADFDLFGYETTAGNLVSCP